MIFNFIRGIFLKKEVAQNSLQNIDENYLKFVGDGMDCKWNKEKGKIECSF